MRSAGRAGGAGGGGACILLVKYSLVLILAFPYHLMFNIRVFMVGAHSSIQSILKIF